MQTQLIDSLLMDVKVYGSATIHFKKLYWLFGKNNECAFVWASLCDRWEEIGGDRAELNIHWNNGVYTLLSAKPHSVVYGSHNKWQHPPLADA